MFKFIKKIFHRTRLIERYEDLDAIIEAHNSLIRKSLDIMRDASVPPKYVLSRFKAIQDAEEKAIAAYWRNRNRKHDKWYRRQKAEESSTMSDKVQETSEKPPEELAAAAPTAVTAAAPDTIDTQALEPSKETVIELHINK